MGRERFGGRADAAMYAAYRDSALVCPVSRLAGWVANTSRVFTYIIGGATAVTDLGFPLTYFPHALEVGALWDPVAIPSIIPGVNSSFPIDAVAYFMSQDTGKALTEYWMSFVATGTPAAKPHHPLRPNTHFFKRKSNSRKFCI